MPHYIFSLIVDDEPGVMQRVVSIFSRRAVNISRISVGPSELSEKTARIIMSFEADPKKAKFMRNLLARLISVKKITQLRADEAVVRELVIIKLKNHHENILEQIKQLTRESNVSLVSYVKGHAIEISGPISEIDHILNHIEQKYVTEIVRSGIIALKR